MRTQKPAGKRSCPRAICGLALLAGIFLPGSVCRAADSKPPSVKISSLVNGQHVRGVVSVEVEASDDTEVREVTVTRDGAFLESASVAPYRITWDTRKEAEGPHNLAVKALDSAGNQGSSPFITVTVDNTPPAVKLSQPARRQTITGKTTLEAQASDIVGVAEVRFLVDGIPVGSARKPPYTASWESKSVSNGVHILEARAWDSAENSEVSEPVEIRVANPNRPPVLSVTGSRSVFEGETLELRLTAVDPDGARDVPAFRGVDLPAWVEVDPRTGEVKISPGYDAVTTKEQQKAYPLRFQACDPEPKCASVEVQVLVSNVNSGPELGAIPDLSVREGDQVLFTLDPAVDPDGDPVTYTAGPLPTWLKFDRESRTFSGTPDYEVAIQQEPSVAFNITVKAADPEKRTDSKGFNVTVANRNRPPQFKRVSDKSQPEGNTFGFIVEATDPDNEIPELTVTGLPPNSAFQKNGDGTGAFVWASKQDQAGVYKLAFTASDTDLKDTMTVTVTLEEASLAISGKIRDNIGQPFTEVKLQMTTAGQPISSVTPDEKGYYIASGLRPGTTYTVKPIYQSGEESEFLSEATDSMGYHFAPLSVRVTVDRADRTDVNFTAHSK